MKRRTFISAGIASGILGTSVQAKNTFAAGKRMRLKLCTTWPPKMPILQESADMFAALFEEATDGKVKIKVFAGGELIPPLSVFDAVSQGTIDLGISAPYYWAGKCQAAQFFGSSPFGMNAQQFNSWLYGGGGQELWEEVYAPFNLYPISLGNTGVQMGGWFRKEIKSPEDLKGLKMRIPGLGARVMAKVGANVILMPGNEIYTALERGTIDATEWIGPFQDERMGLHRIAKFYYYPGWHEPNGNLELIFHKALWDNLPKDFQTIAQGIAAQVRTWMSAKSQALEGPALERLKNQDQIKILPFPDSVLKVLKTASKEVFAEMMAEDPLSKKVFTAYDTFHKQIEPWTEISEEAYARAQKV